MDNRAQTEKSQSKSQPGMWALAGFLVLLMAFYHLRGGEDKGEKAAKSKTPQPQTTSKPETSEIIAAHQAVNWPAIPFNELVEHNPFRPDKAFEEIILGTPEDQAAIRVVGHALKESKEVTRRKKELAQELSAPDRQVRLLFQSSQGAAAMIGDRVVHVGDELDEYYVLKIDRDGVVLKRSPNSDAAGTEGG